MSITEETPHPGSPPTAAPRKANRGRAAGPENRKALIEAARREFLSSGALVPLSRIAKRAGVGQGSLYRHFRDRVDLATAVFEQNLREAGEAIRNSSIPYRTFCDVLSHQAGEASVIIELVTADEGARRAADLRSQVSALVAETYEEARNSGEIGDHVESRDLVAAVSMLCLPLAKALPEDREDEARRIRRILDAWFLRP